MAAAFVCNNRAYTPGQAGYSKSVPDWEFGSFLSRHIWPRAAKGGSVTIMAKPISAYTDVAQLQTVMRNAKRQGREDIYNEAFRRRCELEGIDYDDPLEREFHVTLAAYEELLAEKHGHKQPASYTRRKLRDKGVVQCLQDWALDTKETDGFRTLIDRDLIELTGEYLVTKYPDRFSAEAVSRAKLRLSKVSTV
jgi:hypothetical protein